MASGATDRLNLKDLPVAATECDKFEDMSTPLLSVKVFCENNLDVLFTQDTITVTNADGKTVLKGALNPASDFYMVPLHDTAQPQGGGIHGPKAMVTKEVGSTPTGTKNIANQVNMHHLALGSPTHATFLNAIEKGWLTGFPNLSVKTAKEHCTKKAQTILGHQKLIRQNIRPTSTPIAKSLRTNCHRIGVGAVACKDLRNLVCMDQLGRYPITSARGN